MHESIDTTPSPERPLYRAINDPAPKYLGEIRVDGDGQLWECVLGNHTVARELEIEASGDQYWEERLKTISDDASEAMNKAASPVNPHDSVFGDPVLTWRPYSGGAPGATLH